ncbi:hypothetical protein EQW38_00370 [Lactiplantibacillus plantarum]|nr:hypothetical protein CEB41_00365 [Lactiplantibacillus plantarum]MCT3204529.1 hypothetical protein [Lactiplantibacillus plantarum]MCT3218329.1 hypothetical protein [Lactiplantibacillus plantarum]MCT3234065.1 hypothetical protein [Lactiplantibacillus plantarum]MCT3263103.1 hypothetical protein [Lactiplantibacillus plantarum]
MRVRFRPPGLGDNCWNVSRRRLEPVHKPPSLKYESYSKPEATHFQLRIIWLLSIVTSPSSREAARMADERPLNSVQFVVGYFNTEPFKLNIRVPSPLFRNIQLLLR